MLVSLDLETTGFDPINDKIIEFGAIKFDPLDPHNQTKQQTLQFFTNPGIPIPHIVTHITNITDQDLKNATSFDKKSMEVKNFLGDCPIIGHNIQFDTNFLRHAGRLDIDNPEYDTQQMAAIIFPGLPSYSLEILTKTFNLTHKEKHRAMDDAIAAMELFLKLQEAFEALQKDIIQKFQKLSERSNWPIKRFFLQCKKIPPASTKHNHHTHVQRLAANFREAKIIPQAQNNVMAQNVQQLADFFATQKKSSLHELIPPYNNLTIELAKSATPDTYIAIPAQLFHQTHNQIPDTIAKLDIPENYLSPKRLEEFSQKNFFENHEISALLKYLIWMPNTKTGLLQEVSLFREEKTTLSQVNIQNSAKEPFLQKALQKDQNSPAIITHDQIIEASIENQPQNSKLIIIALEKFLKSFHNFHSTYISLELLLQPLRDLQQLLPENPTIPLLIAKSTILFGIIGIIFQKNSDHNEFTPRSHIQETTLITPEWQKARDTTKNLIEISHELGEIKTLRTIPFLNIWKKHLTGLHNIFFTPELVSHLVWIEENMREEPFIKKTPVSIATKFRNFLQNFSNWQLIDESLDLLDEGKFLKAQNGIPENTPLFKHQPKSENLEISILEKDYDKNQIINTIIDYLKRQKDNSAIIFNSKRELELFTLKLSRAGLSIISQITASLGKLQEQFAVSQPPVTLLLTPNTWHNLENYESINTIFIHKLPFEPPSDPILTAISKNYTSPFTELQIPRATIALKKILNRLIHSCKNKQAILLDPRIITRDYGHAIYKNLESMAATKIINLKNILENHEAGGAIK